MTDSRTQRHTCTGATYRGRCMWLNWKWITNEKFTSDSHLQRCFTSYTITKWLKSICMIPHLLIFVFHWRLICQVTDAAVTAAHGWARFLIRDSIYCRLSLAINKHFIKMTRRKYKTLSLRRQLATLVWLPRDQHHPKSLKQQLIFRLGPITFPKKLSH